MKIFVMFSFSILLLTMSVCLAVVAYAFLEDIRENKRKNIDRKE